MKESKLSVVLIVFLLVCGLDYVAYKDQDFQYKWPVFIAWGTIIVAVILWVLQGRLRRVLSDIKHRRFKIDKSFLLIMFLAIASRFLFLNIYPFQTMGDELRDGGWDAMRIAEGITKNIFMYGRYESHGLIIPTFNSIFYLIFGNTDLTFKVPTAILGTIDILVIYYIARRFINPKAGFIAALVLIATPLHLYYSRTETVVIFSSLITSLVLFSLLYYLEVKSEKAFILLAVMLGFALNFHGSAKASAAIAGLLFVANIIWQYLNSGSLWKSLDGLIGKVLILLMGIVIGFGPRLMFSPPEVMLQTRSVKLTTIGGEVNTAEEKVMDIAEKYKKSCMVYVYEDTMSHYADNDPILNFPLALFFTLGVFSTLIFPDKFRGFIVVYALLLPLTNSAMTECINCDHRLAPYLPFAALITAMGFDIFRKKVINRLTPESWAKTINHVWVAVIAMSLLAFPLVNFFVAEPANDSMFRVHRSDLYQDFMFMHLIKSVQERRLQGEICIIGGKKTIDYSSLLHLKEMFEFYWPDIRISRMEQPDLPDNTIYIARECQNVIADDSWEKVEPCSNYIKYLCPKDNSQFELNFNADLTL